MLGNECNRIVLEVVYDLCYPIIQLHVSVSFEVKSCSKSSSKTLARLKYLKVLKIERDDNGQNAVQSPFPHTSQVR